MSSEDERRESSAEQPKTSLTNEEVVVSAKVASEQGARSNEENPSDGYGDSENASGSGVCIKIGTEAALADVSYDFGQSTMMRAHVTSLESFTRYFLKGFTQSPGVESVPDPQEKKDVVFEDLFNASLCIPPHPILLDILCKFQCSCIN
jgi:hypothetical protein